MVADTTQKMENTMTKTTKAQKTAANAQSAQQHYKALLEIAEKAALWHSTSYKKATDELYALLSECYSSLAVMRNDSTAMVRELNKLLLENGLKFNDGTRLETKVVRVVFGDIGQRAHIYARVLVNAKGQTVACDDFVAWLEEKGGVEAVRKQHKGLTPAQVKAQRVTTAEAALTQVASLELSKAPKADGSDYVLAVVRHTKQGTKIVSFCDNVPLVKQVLANVSANAAKLAETKKLADLEATNRKLLRELGKSDTNADAQAA